MASNITEGINVMSGGLLNRGSMSQNLGLVKDVINGNNFWESWFGNNGIVSGQFMNKHPILSTLVNTAADIVPLKIPTVVKRGLYSGAILNEGTASGSGFLKVPFNRNALGYIATGSEKYADKMLHKATGFPGGYVGEFRLNQTGISRGNPHEVFFSQKNFQMEVEYLMLAVEKDLGFPVQLIVSQKAILNILVRTTREER